MQIKECLAKACRALLYLHDSSHHTKAEFNNYFVIHSRYILALNILTLM